MERPLELTHSSSTAILDGCLASNWLSTEGSPLLMFTLALPEESGKYTLPHLACAVVGDESGMLCT